MPRERIGMSPEEVRALLSQTRWVVLGTVGSAGEPAGHVAPCALVGERLCFAVPPDSEARRHIERDPRVCAATDRYPSYYEIRGVTVHGCAGPIEAPAALAGAGVAYSLPLDDVVSFDFSKIQAKEGA
jgi:nitroimidazol reductase NimA-like FMN-containing flavoprotein (pyridoxamine 5'-phosphate oxidase superfamily)